MSVPEFVILVVVAVTVVALLLRHHTGMRGRAIRIAHEWERARHEMLVTRHREAHARRELRSEAHRTGDAGRDPGTGGPGDPGPAA